MIIAPGIVKHPENERPYFSGGAIMAAALAEGIENDQAARIVGRLVVAALDAERRAPDEKPS